ncbi:hypothetical protein FXO37_36214 [Capsicum annuum]|nr:hypothetical protein FXO37_36214 [Capsicum annuum]
MLEKRGGTPNTEEERSSGKHPKKGGGCRSPDRGAMLVIGKSNAGHPRKRNGTHGRERTAQAVETRVVQIVTRSAAPIVGRQESISNYSRKHVTAFWYEELV